MKPATKTFPVLPTICLLLCLAILAALGIWQVQRLEWKTAMIDHLEQAYRTDAKLTAQNFQQADHQGKSFLYGRVTGRFLNKDEILVGPRTYKEQLGYHVYTPLHLESGDIVMINRGWVPETKADPATRPETLTDETVTVTGMARHPEKPNMFVPANRPEKHEWFFMDLGQAAHAYSLPPMLPYVLYAERPAGQAETVYPIGQDKGWQPPNNHLQYAIFWFMMAGLMLIFYSLRFFWPWWKSR